MGGALVGQGVGPSPANYFDPLTVRGFLRRRHPYDFAETYDVLARVFGYEARYVNLGLWEDGAATEEPGRRLTLHVAGKLNLKPGMVLVDAGAGLGQAAVDLVRQHELGRVDGININRRQVSFANDLAWAEGLQDRIAHQSGDAAQALAARPNRAADAVLAVECAGHFPDPEAFLSGAHRVLVPGGRIALCLNLSSGQQNLVQRAAYWLALGCVPQSLGLWRTRLAQAGFRNIASEDLTDRVLRRGLAICAARVRAPNTGLSPLVAWYLGLQFALAAKAVEQGALTYHVIWAET